MTEQELPFFSVIVPTYNRPRQLAACLQALGETDYPRSRVEVIVVDDGSAETPTEIVRAASEKIPMTLLRQTNAGPAAARNTGAAAANGSLLAFTDDDCAPGAGWLRALAAACAGQPAGSPLLVGGRTVNSLPRNSCAAASQVLIDYLYAYYNARAGGARFFASNNIALSAEGFEALGGFDTTFRTSAGEDRDFCDRWFRRGFPMRYAPDAVISHFHAMTPRTFWRQHFRYGQAAFQFHQRRAQQPHKVEPLSFYTGLLQAPFRANASFPGRREAAEASLLLFLSQVANAAGFASEKIKREKVTRRCD